VTRRRFWTGTTKRDPKVRPAPDLVGRDLSAQEPDRLWVGSHLGRQVDVATLGRDSPLIGRTLAEASIPDRSGLVVIGLRRADGGGSVEVNPSASAVLEAGDDLIVLGDCQQVGRCEATSGRADESPLCPDMDSRFTPLASDRVDSLGLGGVGKLAVQRRKGMSAA